MYKFLNSITVFHVAQQSRKWGKIFLFFCLILICCDFPFMQHANILWHLYYWVLSHQVYHGVLANGAYILPTSNPWEG